MEEFLLFTKYVPMVVLGLIPIMNPLSTIPLLIMLTKHMPDAYRQRQVRRACLYAFAILATFLIVGNEIISLFGISLAGIRVAGGLITLALAFKMLFSGENASATVDATPAQIKEADLDFSFSPLAIPSLSGPGSIAVVIGYGSQIPDDSQVLGHIIVVTGIAVTTAIAYVMLSFSSWIAKLLGPHGLQAVTKIMGFLLTCVAVQFIASGIRDFVTSFH